MTNKQFITIDHLSFSYSEGNETISDLTTTFFKNEKTAIIGPNGSGKTTLFLLLCGILKPNNGTLSINNDKIKYNQFNKQVSYLFQSPDDQLFSATIFDDIAFGPLNMGLPKNEIIKNCESALKKTNISSLKNKSPHHLSGGEKRLAAIATLISMNPNVYIFDEPTSNLDCKNRRDIITLVQDIPSTMIISSHDLEFLLETCSRCILIDNGKIIADREIKELLMDEELLKKHHLEKPHSLIPHSHGLK